MKDTVKSKPLPAGHLFYLDIKYSAQSFSGDENLKAFFLERTIKSLMLKIKISHCE